MTLKIIYESKELSVWRVSPILDSKTSKHIICGAAKKLSSRPHSPVWRIVNDRFLIDVINRCRAKTSTI